MTNSSKHAPQNQGVSSKLIEQKFLSLEDCFVVILSFMVSNLPLGGSPLFCLVPKVACFLASSARAICKLLHRRYKLVQWVNEREKIIKASEEDIQRCLERLSKVDDPAARKTFEHTIAKLERRIATSLSAMTGEQPWLKDGSSAHKATLNPKREQKPSKQNYKFQKLNAGKEKCPKKRK